MLLTSHKPWSLVLWKDVKPGARRVPPAIATAWIDAWILDPHRRSELFRIWEGLTGNRQHARGGMAPVDLQRTLGPRLRRAVESGELVMITEEGGEGWRGAVAAQRASEAAAPPPAESPRPTKTWIEFLVEDMAGQPIAGRKYRATLTDGTKKTGQTDSSGLVRFDELDPGLCEFVLEGLDGNAWEEVDGAAGTDWIEFLVTDGEGRPLGDIRYEARLTNGTLQTGRTTKSGLVRFEGLPGGECQFRLPDYDAEETVDAGEASDWTELLLIGGEGQPMAGVAYEATLADGSSRSGKTGDDGLARLTGLKSGKLEVRFPEVDAEPEGE